MDGRKMSRSEGMEEQQGVSFAMVSYSFFLHAQHTTSELQDKWEVFFSITQQKIMNKYK